VGIVIGSALGFIFIVVVACVCYRQNRRSPDQNTSTITSNPGAIAAEGHTQPLQETNVLPSAPPMTEGPTGGEAAAWPAGYPGYVEAPGTATSETTLTGATNAGTYGSISNPYSNAGITYQSPSLAPPPDDPPPSYEEISRS
jgi:hypothetical protein